MKENELPKDDLKCLLIEAFNKLEKTEEEDTKLLQEKSNTLNWILTLTTLFIGLTINNYSLISEFYFKETFFLAEKVLFGISLVMLIFYKLIYSQYERYKKSFLANLHTHKIELLFDIDIKLKPKLTNDPVFVPTFINNFRDGYFIPDYDTNRKIALKKLDNNVKIFGKLLNIIYLTTMILFFLNLFIIITFVINIYI